MTKGTVLVASPSAIGRPPEASGSSVPAWPARLAWNSRFTTATAWVEFMPPGLSSTPQPWTSRLSRLGWPFWREALPPRPGPASRWDSAGMLAGSPSEPSTGASIMLFAVIAVIRSLFRIFGIWCEVSQHRGCAQQFLYPFRFLEPVVDAEADIGREFQVDAVGDLAAQKLLVALERRDHDIGIAPAERHHVDRRELQVRGHPYLGHGDDVTLQLRIVHAALGQDLRNRVAHEFADAQLTLRAAGGGTLLLLAGHCRLSKPSCPALAGHPRLPCRVR